MYTHNSVRFGTAPTMEYFEQSPHKLRLEHTSAQTKDDPNIAMLYARPALTTRRYNVYAHVMFTARRAPPVDKRESILEP